VGPKDSLSERDSFFVIGLNSPATTSLTSLALVEFWNDVSPSQVRVYFFKAHASSDN
jgi:hypothetical protein